MLGGNLFGEAGHEVLIEEFMNGEELSIFAVTDGHSFVVLPALQDHKRLLDGDRGPNTGGMGAYVPVTLPDPVRPGSSFDAEKEASLSVFIPTLRALAERGRPFTGLLYAGLMLTPDGAKVVEFNCRFGDPETQALVPLLLAQPSLLHLVHAVATGATLGGTPVLGGTGADRLPPPTRALAGACVTTVLAAAHYPGRSRVGDIITLPAEEADVQVFHAGTARNAQGQLVTAGGRVLSVSALGENVAAARERSMAHAARIMFEGKQCRTDIGWREIARLNDANARTARD